jgi:hypothetical protein
MINFSGYAALCRSTYATTTGAGHFVRMFRIYQCPDFRYVGPQITLAVADTTRTGRSHEPCRELRSYVTRTAFTTVVLYYSSRRIDKDMHC